MSDDPPPPCPLPPQNRIVQVSIYNSYPKFGLHKVGHYGEIVISKGLNLSPAEFDCFLSMLKEEYGDGAKKLKSTPSTGRGVSALSFPVHMYTWKCNPIQSYYSVIIPSVTTGMWYVSPQRCLVEAEQNRPSGQYEVDFTWKRDLLEKMMISLMQSL